jgi:alkanesulfonate monooxygenase SsuD/methylene tetrahydromethanopterin reductase-like flavin-dependent oxidoreductase (luciferase family)
VRLPDLKGNEQQVRLTHLAFELRTNTPEPVLAGIAERVEASGYRSVWVNHPPDADGIGQLAKVAAVTSRITLGTAVVPVSAVPPEAIVRRIAETELPVGRLRLGIGSGSGPRPLRRIADAIGYLRPRIPAEIVVGALGPRMRELAATQADGVLLNNVTPALARAAAEEIRAQAGAAGRPVPGVYVNVMIGVGADQLAELEGSAAFLSRLPAYAAHFDRTGIRPEQTWIAAERLSELAPLLHRWRDTVDEVVLVPVRADEAGPAGDLVDAAITSWDSGGTP